MNNFEQQLRHISQEAKKVTLSEKDKHVLRSNLEAFVKSHPAQEGVESIVVRGALGRKSFSYRKMHPNLTALFRGVLVGVLGAVLVGGGVASAATDALPGDALYPVKINLNEKVQSLVTISPEAQAKLQTEFAETRLREAETLALQGKLSAQTQENLEERFEEHAKASEKSLSEIQGQDKEAIIAEIQSEFEAALAAHEELLSRLAAQIGTPQNTSETMPGTGESEDATSTAASTGSSTLSASSTEVSVSASSTLESTSTTISQDASSSTASTSEATSTPKADLSATTTSRVQAFNAPQNTKNIEIGARIDSILSWIRGQKEQIAHQREDVEKQVFSQVKSQVEVLTSQTRDHATAQINSAENVLKNGNGIPEEVKQQAEGNMDDAHQAFAEGEAKFEAKDYSEAYSSYRTAIRNALQAEILVETSQELKLSADIRALVGNSSNTEQGTSEQNNSGTGTGTETASNTPEENASSTESTSTGNTDAKNATGTSATSTQANASSSEASASSTATNTFQKMKIGTGTTDTRLDLQSRAEVHSDVTLATQNIPAVSAPKISVLDQDSKHLHETKETSLRESIRGKISSIWNGIF
ncbi:MAG TPA: DUF5667 domain-containing protein [Candidatus Paceibacterota bacterium]|nr:DUF5667 domain-containing protein [Candidatus Paceibacterota bacterium]